MSTADPTGSGHSTGTVVAETRADRGSRRRALDTQSCVPAWPRLVNLVLAGLYLGVSPETVRGHINAGRLKPVRVPRPNTPRAWRRRPIDDTVRRLLLDTRDLDALVEAWKSEGGR